LSLGNVRIMKTKSPEDTIKALPMFHVAMLIYAVTIIANYAIMALI